MNPNRLNTQRKVWCGKLAGWRFIVLFIVLAFSQTLSQVHAQTDPCRDLDGDGYFAGAGCAVQDDCNDLNPTIHPLASESCNGFDDDCDGELDEGCIRTCEDYDLRHQVKINENVSKSRIATAEKSWAIMYSDGATYFPYYLTRFSFSGERLSPDRLYSGDESPPEIATSDHEILWDGTRMAIGWNWTNYPFGSLFREVGPWGVSENSPLLLSSPNNNRKTNRTILWNGYEYAVFYYNDGIYKLHRISAESSDLGEQALFDADFEPSFVDNGNGYGVLLDRLSEITNVDELYFRKITREGALDGPEIQLTSHPGLEPNSRTVSDRLKIVKAGPGQGYGITWSEWRTNVWNVFFARLDEDGNLMTPPGEVEVSDVGGSLNGVLRAQDLIWNGEEFMLAWTKLGAALCGEIYLARISVDGTILENKVVVPGLCNTSPRLAWNGVEYGMVFTHYINYLLNIYDSELAMIGCNCNVDGDSDGVLPCGSGDCDDSDPDVALGMTEICNDGKDNDCDGLVDCNDPDCGQGGNPPSEITGVGFDDKVTLVWAADSKADDYDIARGSLADLKAMENYRWADCLGSRIGGTIFVDSEIPPVGVAWYYQLRGHARTCLIGSWGDQLKDDTLHSCP